MLSSRYASSRRVDRNFVRPRYTWSGWRGRWRYAAGEGSVAMPRSQAPLMAHALPTPGEAAPPSKPLGTTDISATATATATTTTTTTTTTTQPTQPITSLTSP